MLRVAEAAMLGGLAAVGIDCPQASVSPAVYAIWGGIVHQRLAESGGLSDAAPRPIPTALRGPGGALDALLLVASIARRPLPS